MNHDDVVLVFLWMRGLLNWNYGILLLDSSRKGGRPKRCDQRGRSLPKGPIIRFHLRGRPMLERFRRESIGVSPNLPTQKCLDYH